MEHYDNITLRLDIVSNCLLAIHSQSKHGHATPTIKNRLNKYLKKCESQTRYKLIKGEIKQWRAIIKRGGDIEGKLSTVNDEYWKYFSEMSDVDSLYQTVKYLEDEGKLKLELLREGSDHSNLEQNIIYVDEGAIGDAFDDNDAMIKPVELITTMADITHVVSLIASYGKLKVTQTRQTENIHYIPLFKINQ